MPPRATKRAKTRLSTMTTRVSSTVINSPASSGPKFATAMSRLKISIREVQPGLGDFEIDEVVFEHRLQAPLVEALHLVDLGLERGRCDADLAQIEIGGGARDVADLLVLQIVIRLDSQRVALGDDDDRPIPVGGTGEADHLVALGGV